MKHVYSDRANTPWSLNAASIIMYKSSRKNAKDSGCISINHLISHDADRKIDDARIVDQFHGVLDAILCYSLSVGGYLEVYARGVTFKPTTYINVDGDMYHTVENIPFTYSRQRYYSFEQVVNFVYYIFSMIYPYNTLNLQADIYNDSSIRKMIRKYYGRD